MFQDRFKDVQEVQGVKYSCTNLSPNFHMLAFTNHVQEKMPTAGPSSQQTWKVNGGTGPWSPTTVNAMPFRVLWPCRTEDHPRKVQGAMPADTVLQVSAIVKGQNFGITVTEYY